MARNRGVSITVSKEMQQWINGLREDDLGDAAREEWRAANDVFFSRTQQYVHVISGDLKRSGLTDVEVIGKQIIATTEYGANGLASYAIYEIRRGNSHDFIGRAAAATRSRFQEGIGGAVAAQIIANVTRGR